MIDPTAYVHPKAHVEDSHVGARTKVWQFASVIRGARIGEDCSIASGACVDGSVIGDGTIIAHNLAMGPGFSVGRGCFIGPNCTFVNDVWPSARKEGFRPELFDGERWAVIMEDGASVGANAVIMAGVRLGAGCMVAAGSVVTRDVPAGHLFKDGKSYLTVMTRPARMRFARELGRER